MTDDSPTGINSTITEVDYLFPEIPPCPYIFFSFDLVNSTLYKIKQKEDWPIVFAQFFRVIKEEMKNRFQDIKVWKYIGDEILFFMKLNSRNELSKILPCAFDALNCTLENLKKVFNSILEPLSLKSTIWLAPVMFIEGEELKNLGKIKTKNIAFEVNFENQTSLIDFVGPDIDTGFRISKYAEKGKLVVSAELAYMIFIVDLKKELFSNLKIVSYEDLKGIWDDRFYPIIFYYDDWNHIKNSFKYDDRFKSKIINNICSDNVENLDKLETIFQQLRFCEEINYIMTELESAEKVIEEKAKEKPGKQIPLIVPEN